MEKSDTILFVKQKSKFLQIVSYLTTLVLIAIPVLDGGFSKLTVPILFTTLIILVLGIALLEVSRQFKIKSLQKQGIYPTGWPTDEDVLRVLRAREKVFAIRLYQQVHHVQLKEALEAVNQLG